MKNMCVVIGARPQYIKHACMDNILRQKYNVTIVDTCQHYDNCLSDIFFDGLNIPQPDIQLNIGSGLHGEQTGNAIIYIEKELKKNNYDYVLVYGDTNTSLSGALAAAKLNIPVVHIESGLRSFDRTMPEEVNRVLIDHLSSVLYYPTHQARLNLVNEGIEQEKIRSFDVVSKSVKDNIDKAIGIDNCNFDNYILATVHRKSNLADRYNLMSILKAMKDSNFNIVFPLHPGTRNKMLEFGIYDYALNIPNISFIDPVGYLEMLNLLFNSICVITDSGGLQHEADILNKPCITLRDNTEWVESLCRQNVLVGNDYNKILDEIKRTLSR